MNAAGIAKEIASVVSLHRNDKNRTQKEKSLVNNIFKNQTSLKIKQQKRRPEKGRLGGDRAAFTTPSLSPLQRKKCKRKNKS